MDSVQIAILLFFNIHSRKREEIKHTAKKRARSGWRTRASLDLRSLLFHQVFWNEVHTTLYNIIIMVCISVVLQEVLSNVLLTTSLFKYLQENLPQVSPLPPKQRPTHNAQNRKSGHSIYFLRGQRWIEQAISFSAHWIRPLNAFLKRFRSSMNPVWTILDHVQHVALCCRRKAPPISSHRWY